MSFFYPALSLEFILCFSLAPIHSFNHLLQVLVWGTTVAGAYTNASVGAIATIERASLCGAPANESGFMDLGATVTAEVRVCARDARSVASSAGNSAVSLLEIVQSDAIPAYSCL